MTAAEKYFTALTAQIPGVVAGKMFGALCMKTPNGKSAAMLWKDDIVVKLEGDNYKEALAIKGAALFEPMAGKPMKEWVQIPFAHKDKWKPFVLISAASVGALPAKKTAVKKKPGK